MVETVILNKNSIFNAFFIFMGLFTAGVVQSSEKHTDNKEWLLWKNLPNLQIYYRPLHNTDLIELKANLIVESKLSSFLLFIQDTQEVSSWLDNAYKSEIIKQINENENLRITYFEGMWPIKPRNAVLKTKVVQNEDLSVDIFSIDASEDFPLIDDSVRVRIIKAYWHITPIKNTNKIEIEYHVAADPKGNIPKVLLKGSTLKSLFNTMSNIQRLLPSSRWQNYQLSTIIDQHR